MSTSLNRMHKVSGFTLIEVMIVVAIVGILSAIAYPSYEQPVRSSRRADAQAALLELAQFMERRFTENNGYDLAPAGLEAGDMLPFTQSPREHGGLQSDAAPCSCIHGEHLHVASRAHSRRASSR